MYRTRIVWTVRKVKKLAGEVFMQLWKKFWSFSLRKKIKAMQFIIKKAVCAFLGKCTNVQPTICTENTHVILKGNIVYVLCSMNAEIIEIMVLYKKIG